MSISQILIAIKDLLKNPVPDLALDKEIAKVYLENRELYEKTAKEWTEKYAKE